MHGGQEKNTFDFIFCRDIKPFMPIQKITIEKEELHWCGMVINDLSGRDYKDQNFLLLAIYAINKHSCPYKVIKLTRNNVES